MISKSATDKQNCTTGAQFTKSARAAWSHILRANSGTRAQRVLLPAYIGFTEREGSGVFDPVQENNSEFAFYRLNADLSVNMDDLRAQLAKGADFLLVIHYFGFCRSDMHAIRALCDDYRTALVEDCAHAFHLETPGSTLGTIGDFAFYSLHKFIATDSGGILKTNGTVTSLPPLLQEDRAGRDVLEQYALSDFNRIKTIRRQNYALYAELLDGVDQIEKLYSLNDTETPQTFPIRVKGGKREALYFYLMDRNIPTTALYYRMIDEIDPAKYPESVALSESILNLPVHQDTTSEDVRVVCENLRAFFSV